MFRRQFSFLVAIAAILLSSPAQAQLACDAPLFATGFDKMPVQGTKAALIDAVSMGNSIRIGWELDFDEDGTGDLTHWADADFLSIWKGEVFTQVQAIHTQSPQRNEADIKLRSPYTEWRGSIGTTGTLDGRYTDNADFPDLKVATMWCAADQVHNSPVLLYRHDADGQPVAGSIEALLSAIREGQSIRLGWGFSRELKGKELKLEHLIEPVFITAVNEKDVSAQLPEHIAQRAYHEVENSFFDDPSVMWRGLMTTQGTFDTAWVNRGTGETIRKYPQRAAISWYGSTSPVLSTPSLAVRDGARADETRESEKFTK